jgi:hypothetical protein
MMNPEPPAGTGYRGYQNLAAQGAQELMNQGYINYDQEYKN